MNSQADHNRQAERARVFISYKRAEPDEMLALALRDGLATHYDVFIDKNIPTGAHWARRINEEIELADYFVVLLSHLSVRSEMVLGEIDTARELAAERPERRPRILPVRVAFHERLPFPLNAWFQFVNWTDWHTQEDTSRVIEQLRRSLTVGLMLHSPLYSASAPGMPIPASNSPISLPSAPRRGEPPPKGALPLTSRYYVERSADRHLRTLLQREQCVTISIRGPRQIGKTSLLARSIREAKDQGRRVALIDFQLFEKSTLPTREPSTSSSVAASATPWASSHRSSSAGTTASATPSTARATSRIMCCRTPAETCCWRWTKSTACLSPVSAPTSSACCAAGTRAWI
jgi:hypothetical protein